MTDQAVGEMEGAIALPRQNGELIFEEPWESRAFGIAVALAEGGAYAWEDFRLRLIGEIQDWEHDQKGDGAATDSGAHDWTYYRHWLVSLERVLLERGVVSADELAERERVLAAADKHDHDHAHGHDHSHDHDHAHDDYDDTPATREVTT